MRETRKEWILANNCLEIALSKRGKGGISRFTDVQTGRHLIDKHAGPLYRLLLWKKGSEPVECTSLDAEDVSVEFPADSRNITATLTYSDHDPFDIRVTCSVSLEQGSTLSKWRIAVQNHTDYGIRAIRFPIIIAPSFHGSYREQDYLLIGEGSGRLIRGPFERHVPRLAPGGLGFRATGGQRETWAPQWQYPGQMAVQLQAYYTETVGLYVATYDGEGQVKHFGPMITEDGLDLSVEHNFDECPGVDFELPYDTIVGAFHGDWYEAADLYKTWACRQSWCAKKITERDDIPLWLKESRPYLAVITRGNYDRLRAILSHPPAEFPIAKFWPAKRVVPLMREYARIFDTPVVTWMEGWEWIGAPGGPVDIFPPYEGEASFRSAMADLRRDGNPPAMYLAGLHWCYKRPSTGYDGWARFEREGLPLAALNDQGQPILCDLNARTYADGQKYFAPLCVGCEATQALFLNNFEKLMELGAVMLQLDQQVGCYSEVCYSEDHGHPAGYARWMTDHMRSFLRRVVGKAKERDPEAILAYEFPCELWIQETQLIFDRPYMIGVVPLFDYIYHEYAPLYGGDMRMGVCHPEEALIKHATLFACGLQNLVGIGEPEYDFEVNPNYPVLVLIRNICLAQRTYANPYVVLGQMQRPAELAVEHETIDLYRYPGTVQIPKVLHSVWKSPEGKLGYVLANWTGSPQVVALTLMAEAGGPISIVTAAGRRMPNADELTGATLTLTVPARDVLLVEREG